MAAGTLPLADAPALWPFARRTRLVRLGLGLAVLGLFAAAVYSAFHLHTRATSYFAQGGRGILVIDLSASVDPRANQRLRTLMRTLANSDQRLGLVAFEEQTYELLPPGTRGDEIRPMLRFFGTESPSARKETPWSVSFLGGTNIGPALRLARQIAERNGAGAIRQGGARGLLHRDLRVCHIEHRRIAGGIADEIRHSQRMSVRRRPHGLHHVPEVEASRGERVVAQDRQRREADRVRGDRRPERGQRSDSSSARHRAPSISSLACARYACNPPPATLSGSSSPTSVSRATQSRSGSTPKTPRPDSCRRPAGSKASSGRRATASASTPGSRPGPT